MTTSDLRTFVTEARDKAKATTHADIAEVAAQVALDQHRDATTYGEGLRDGVISALEAVLAHLDAHG